MLMPILNYFCVCAERIGGVTGGGGGVTGGGGGIGACSIGSSFAQISVKLTIHPKLLAFSTLEGVNFCRTQTPLGF